MTLRKITTNHSRKPIPTDRLDWAASFEDSDPEVGLIGFGSTREDAVDDLLDQAGPDALVKSWASPP